MINKRLLIKNLLAHNDENSFYDKKRSLDLGPRRGKAKFLKHVCALANSNPRNHSFMVIGVEDIDNDIRGVDFFDDSKIQNLVNAYLENPPQINYENVLFPHLPEGKVVGLVTIRSSGSVCALSKNIWKYYAGMVFIREGSISKPVKESPKLVDMNSGVVSLIEKNARNNIELTLDGVIDFINHRHGDLPSYYKVFKEQFVVCWAGNRKLVGEDEYFSRVDIELINEQVKMFFSKLDEVAICFSADTFQITEYVYLGLGAQKRYFPLEEVTFTFADNGTYHIQSDLIFNPPQYDRKTLYHVMNTNKSLLVKLEKGLPFSRSEERDLSRLPATLLICYLNGFEEAQSLMQDARKWLREKDRGVYDAMKEALRILRKVRYN